MVRIDCTFTDADGDIDIRLLNAGGTQLDISASSTDNEQIIYDVGGAGTYYIHVAFESRGNLYDIRYLTSSTIIDMNGFWHIMLDNVTSQGQGIGAFSQDVAGNVYGIFADVTCTGNI